MKLAADQHGVVARFQLLRLGVSSDVLEHRLAAGWLRRLHRGVYLVGPLAVPHSRELAAVLACGGNAVLSRRHAAWVWQLQARPGDGERVGVIVFRGRASSRPGIDVRNVHSLRGDEITVRDGIPITTPARTLYDLAGVAGERELERAVAEALARRLVGRSGLLSLVDRHGGRPGAARLRALIDAASDQALTRSEAEERLLALTRKARMSAPATNARVAGYEVDFLWRAERLVVEVDGHAYHASSRRFESDRRRDADLLAAGVRVMRVTWHQIVNEPEALLVRLGRALATPAQV